MNNELPEAADVDQTDAANFRPDDDSTAATNDLADAKENAVSQNDGRSSGVETLETPDASNADTADAADTKANELVDRQPEESADGETAAAADSAVESACDDEHRDGDAADDQIDAPTENAEAASMSSADAQTEPDNGNAADVRFDELSAKFDQLSVNQAELQRLINEKVVIDANREAIIDRLHAELQEYKQGMIRKIMLPMIMEIIMLYDDIGKSIAAHQDKVDDAPDAQNLLNLFKGVQEDIENLLYKHDVEPYNCESDEFDPKLQRPLKSITTDQSELDRKIADRLRKGFKHDERVIRPEWVSVYKYQQPAEEAQQGE